MALKDQYPMVYKILNDYVRAGTGEDNIIQTLHGFMGSADDKFALQLKDEFNTLAEDESISDEELLREFNTDLDEDYIIMTNGNTRSLLIVLAEFVDYSYSKRTD